MRPKMRKEIAWVPPESKYITVKDLVCAIQLACKGDTSNLLDIYEGLDKLEFYENKIVLMTPQGQVITPVKLGDHWTNLSFRVGGE